MSDVERYDIGYEEYSENDVACMDLSDDGDYVSYEDYQKIDAQTYTLIGINKRLSEQIDGLYADNDRLKELLLKVLEEDKIVLEGAIKEWKSGTNSGLRRSLINEIEEELEDES